MSVSWGHPNKSPQLNNRNVLSHSPEARVQVHSVGRVGSF